MENLKQRCLAKLNEIKNIFTDLNFDYAEHKFESFTDYQLQTTIEMTLYGKKFLYIINYQYFENIENYSCMHLIKDDSKNEFFRKDIEVTRNTFQQPETNSPMYNYLFDEFFDNECRKHKKSLEVNPFVRALTLELNTFNRMKIKEFIMSINKTVENGFILCKPFLK